MNIANAQFIAKANNSESDFELQQISDKSEDSHKSEVSKKS